MNSYKHLKNVLYYNINVRSLFCEDAESDFIRVRKLSFETIIKNVICTETGSLKDELLKLNDYSIDGSVLAIDNTIYDSKTSLLKIGKINCTYSAYHLNTSYDLLTCLIIILFIHTW